MERRLDAWDLLYRRDPDGLAPRACCGRRGLTHVPGVREGASENAEVTSVALLGAQKFVRDRWLESAQEGRRCSANSPHPACRNHKLRSHLPKDQHPQVRSDEVSSSRHWLLRPAYAGAPRCSRSTGSASLRKCLGSTNLISTHSGVRQKTRRVLEERSMALRWAACLVETEKSYRRIIGYDQLWMLRAHLDDHEPVAEMRKAG